MKRQRAPKTPTPTPSAEAAGRWPNGHSLVSAESGRLCTVIEARRQDDKWLFYVHWNGLNRRMDSWVSEDLLQEIPQDAPSKKAATQLIEFVEEEYGEEITMDEHQIREHEEVTKMKNVNRIQLGRHIADTWFFSPIPKEYCNADGSPIDILYFCEFSLNFFMHESELARHYKRAAIRHPPGDEIYRDTDARLSMFEVDGSKAVVYCQNLSYYAKFFLDHKTLQWDTQPFLFYVMCEFDEYGYHPVGYFSKEKYSDAGFNLACILTFPQYQRRGFGNFLISFSYELSKKEEKVGSPEKPISDLGQISYTAYWCRAVLEELRHITKDPAMTQVSIMDLTCRTAIHNDDVILALKHMTLLKDLGNGTFSIDCTQDALEACGTRIGTSSGPAVKPELLHWAPLKVVEAKKDKWAMKSKLGQRNRSHRPLPSSAPMGSGAMRAVESNGGGGSRRGG